MNKSKSLKSAFTKGSFDAEFIELCKKELPGLWGRLSLLEEFYDANAPGMGDRSRIVSDQLGRPTPMKRGLLTRLRMSLSNR